MMRPRVIASAVLACLAVSGATSQAQAPAWPTRSVKLVVPLGPGAGADIGARLFADKLSQRWGQSVVVENR
jgi:tripartite-type tricarboxylate transporter receptor subunit TctC